MAEKKYIGRYGEEIRNVSVCEDNGETLIMKGWGKSKEGENVPVFFEVSTKTGKKDGFYRSYTPIKAGSLYDTHIEEMNYKDDLLDGREIHYWTLSNSQMSVTGLPLPCLIILQKEWSRGEDVSKPKEEKRKTGILKTLNLAEKAKMLEEASKEFKKGKVIPKTEKELREFKNEEQKARLTVSKQFLKQKQTEK